MSAIISGYVGNFLPSRAINIASGEQESEAINCGGMELVGIRLPAVMTGTALTFEVGDSEDGYQAEGQITFSGTTTDGDTLELNGVTITFVDTSPGADEVLIGATAAETAGNLMTFLAASDDADLLAMTYVIVGAVIQVKAIVYGTAGNAYTFDKSSTDIALSPSGGTLAGGGFRPLYNASNSQVSMTVAAGRAYAVDPTYFHGIPFLKVKSGSTEAANRQIYLSLRG